MEDVGIRAVECAAPMLRVKPINDSAYVLVGIDLGVLLETEARFQKHHNLRGFLPLSKCFEGGDPGPFPYWRVDGPRPCRNNPAERSFLLSDAAVTMPRHAAIAVSLPVGLDTGSLAQ
jgi:hypothetical protein